MPLTDYVDPIPPAIDHRTGDTVTTTGTLRSIETLHPPGHYRFTLDVDTTAEEAPRPDLRDRIRAKISDAYYDVRNTGGTMEGAADRAADDVIALLNLGRLG